jgi:alpha-ketoglutaric semialdehyde dehydrogenase
VTAVGEVEAERAGSRARRPRFDRFAELAETGQIAVNLPTTGWDVHMPFGGFRESGSAFEEQGLDALRFYTRTKTVAVHFDG